MCLYIPVHLKIYEKIEIFPWAFIWLASWKILVSQELTLHLSPLTNTVQEAKWKSPSADYFCNLHLTFSINNENKLLMEFTIYIENYIGEKKTLTNSSFSNNPGEANEEHDTPDIQHASYLWIDGAGKRTWEVIVGQDLGLSNFGVQVLLTLRLREYWIDSFHL